MSRKSKIIIWLIIAGLATTILRETGRLKVQLYRASFEGKRQHQGKSYKFWSDDEKYTETRNTYHGDGDANNHANGWLLGFTTSVTEAKEPETVRLSDPGSRSHLTAALRARLAEQVSSVAPALITIESVELSGGYWLPLMKSGSCEYKITIVDERRWHTNHCAMSGRMDFSVSGLSSVREAEEMLSDNVAKQVAETMKHFKEYQ